MGELTFFDEFKQSRRITTANQCTHTYVHSLIRSVQRDTYTHYWRNRDTHIDTHIDTHTHLLVLNCLTHFYVSRRYFTGRHRQWRTRDGWKISSICAPSFNSFNTYCVERVKYVYNVSTIYYRRHHACSIEYTFPQDFLEIPKMFRNFYKILQKCFLGTTCIVVSVQKYKDY